MQHAPNTLQAITEIFWQSLEGEDVDLADLKARLATEGHFGEYGLDSLALVEFFLRLQSAFGISIRQEDYPSLVSLDAVRAYIEDKTAARKAS